MHSALTWDQVSHLAVRSISLTGLSSSAAHERPEKQGRNVDVQLGCQRGRAVSGDVRDISYQRGTRQCDIVLSWLTRLNIEVPDIAGVFA